MIKKIVLCLCVLFVFTSSPVLAGEWSGATGVIRIYPHSTNNTNGTVYYSFDVMKNPSGCQNGTLIALKKSNNLSSEIYSLLLMAFTTKLKVNYYVDGCDATGYAELLHVSLSA